MISTTMTATTTDNDSVNGDGDFFFFKDNNKDPNGGECKDNNKQKPISFEKRSNFWSDALQFNLTTQQLNRVMWTQ